MTSYPERTAMTNPYLISVVDEDSDGLVQVDLRSLSTERLRQLLLEAVGAGDWKLFDLGKKDLLSRSPLSI
jgi:hypothetical protein